MARKYKIHRYYSVMCQLKDKGLFRYDELTLREARRMVSFINTKLQPEQIDIVKRLYSEHESHGVINLEEI